MSISTPSLEYFVKNYPSSAIFLDASHLILLVSENFLENFDLKSSNIIGCNIFDIFTKFSLTPDTETLRSVTNIARSTKRVYITPDVQVKSGTYWYIRSNPIVYEGLLTHSILSMHETTANHHAKQAFTDQMDNSDLYRNLVEQVKDYAIFMLDPAGKVKTWNSGAELLKGYTKDEIVGKHFSIFYPKEDVIAGKPGKELEIALSKGRVEDESLRVKKDGSTIWAHVTITQLTRDGKHVGFSKVTRDLTEHRAAEKRLIEAYKTSERQQSEFLANMTHEIRTPLHGLLGSLEELVQSGVANSQPEILEDMKRSGRFLDHIIGGILDCSQLEAGGMSLRVSDFNLRTITHAITSSLKYAKKSGVMFEVVCDPDVPETVRGDPDRYQQVLSNVTSNALKFTEQGSVFVRISVQSEDNMTYTIIATVTDTGIGISENEQSALFKRFTQVDHSSTKKYQGTGLGLAISKGIVELMDGTIWYQPSPTTKGSMFQFTAKFRKTAAITPMSEDENMMESLDLDPKVSPKMRLAELAPAARLLLAEDNEVNRKVALKMLGRLGFTRIDCVANGAEAVEKAKENRLMYDLILMDIQMPIMDGKQATKEIRLSGIGVPIIAMTANALKRDIDEYLAIGMNAWVSKPVNVDLLVETLLEHLN